MNETENYKEYRFIAHLISDVYNKNTSAFLKITKYQLVILKFFEPWIQGKFYFDD